MMGGFLDRVGRRAEQYGRVAAERAGEHGDDARGELRRLWSRMEDIVERRAPTTSEAADYAGRYAREGREVAYDAADRLSSATRAQPLLVLGIAVAATWIIASLLRRR